MKKTIPKAPKNLSKESKCLWKTIVTEYNFTDSGGLTLLQTALEALDRLREAQAILKKTGLLVRDRFSQIRVNPVTIVERDSRSQFLHAMRMLNLDLEPLKDGPGRPLL